MRLGIGTYTYTWSVGFPGATPEHPLTVLDLLERAKELDVKGMEVYEIGNCVTPRKLLEAIHDGARVGRQI